MLNKLPFFSQSSKVLYKEPKVSDTGSLQYLFGHRLRVKHNVGRNTIWQWLAWDSWKAMRKE